MRKSIVTSRLGQIIFILTAMMFWAAMVSAEEIRMIPREILFGNPQKTIPQVSPDGVKMAYLAPVDDVLNVWVKTIGADDDKPVTKDTNRGVRIYFWAENSQGIMYLQDIGGNENWRLYGVDLGSGETRDLTPFDSVQVQIVGHEKQYPNELLIAMNKENPQLHDVYHMDLTTGEMKMAARNPGNVIGWVNDADLKVRGAMGATAEGGFELLVRPDENSEWQNILTWDSESSLNSGPIGFSRDGKYLYLLDSRQSNACGLVKLDIATGKTELIASDPQYDVSNALVDPNSYEVQAVAFNKDRVEWKVLDQSIRKDFDKISKLDRGDMFITDRDNADNIWIAGFTADNGPVPFYAFDRKSQKATFLFYNRPDLKDYTLAPMEPVTYKARDGMTIHGYITFPLGKAHKNLPLVLNVHGGPWYRDTWGFNSEAQWLANRGYICLQVNFRGSVGYGKDFINAGDREWGGKMQDDLTDAVKWAIDKGYADPQKVAIYGGSYGGYATLAGATFTPDLYKCAVDIVGPSNLVTWITTIPPYWSSMRTMLYKRIGNPETEADFLKSRSPLFKADQIKIPMLIAQGANDPRVNAAESEQIVEAMKKNGVDYEYILFPDEGHGFARPENRLKFYGIAEKFLAKHLGGRYEEVRAEAQP